MKQKLHNSISVLLLLLSFHCFSQKTVQNIPVKKSLPNDISEDWYASAIENINRQANDFYPQAGNNFRAVNTTQKIGFIIRPDGYAVHNLRTGDQSKDWEILFHITGMSRTTTNGNLGNAFVIVRQLQSLNYQYEKMILQYVNDESGLRQNFIIQERPNGTGRLKIAMHIESGLKAKLVAEDKLVFHAQDDPKDIRLVYEDLNVWDAAGKKLNACMSLTKKGSLLELIVDDSNAKYPVTVDPLNRTPEWNTSADGVVSGLLSQGQLEASLYGFSVAGVGDVNGDSYGDVAVGAPSMVDIFSGSGTLAGVGAVFVFYGSPNGLSTIPAKTLQPNTCVAGALFGASIDGGDVTGDGINDIVIGAPADRISLVAGIIPINGTVGKVYVYPGGNLSSPNPSNFLSLHLTTTYINLLNISNNALFGFSVAITEDLNGDGKKDILVGSPTFASASLILVKTGAAFLFLSGANNSFPTIQSMDMPDFNLLGISVPIINSISGLLFGYSVDGLGDYNNDGRSDIVVGSPAGVDISGLTGILSGQVLGGQAYVYYGTSNNSGVNTNIGAKLQAPGGLLGNLANLFGFDVKGVRGVNGQRNGNIVIGAPVGGTIPNALSLTIQTGNIQVFKKKMSSPAGIVTADQVLESPRSTSVLQLLGTLDLNVMLGASLDNAYDINCDGFPDLIAGEPLSSGTGLLSLQANAVGGAAYIYYGNATGGYSSTPGYDVSATYGSDFLSVNTTGLFGFSVAGVKGVKGPLSAPRILVGAPTGALDFDNSILNLGSTIGLLFDFTLGNNGLGKAYMFRSAVCLDNSPLPVTLINFTAQKQQKSVMLNWASFEEANLKGYELQKSADGNNFNTIALVFARNSVSRSDYNFKDEHPVQGINYYRLKMIDNDDHYSYSNTVSVKFEESIDRDIIIAPNPVQSEAKVKFTGLNKGIYKMEFFNSNSQLVQTKTINITQFEQYESLKLDKRVGSGVYWLNISDKNNTIKTLKVLVQ
jgi:hypothetical protein